jgi:hypothetical protein
MLFSKLPKFARTICFFNSFFRFTSSSTKYLDHKKGLIPRSYPSPALLNRHIKTKPIDLRTESIRDKKERSNGLYTRSLSRFLDKINKMELIRPL